MNIETKKLLKAKIAEIDVKITTILLEEEQSKKLYDGIKSVRIALQQEKQKIKEDIPD